MDRQGPLTDADFDELKARMDELEFARREIEKAERAGMDMAAAKDKVRELDAQLKKIKQVYFPGR